MARPRRPPALRHGLASRTTRLEYSDDVEALAEALIGASPREARVVEAARAEAEAILYLRRVRQCRLQVLEEGTLARCSATAAARDLARDLSRAVKCGSLEECRVLGEALIAEHDRQWILDLEATATFVLGDELAERGKELRRLSEYERRAHSARRKTLRRLDYERVEAERRCEVEDASHLHANTTQRARGK